MQRCPECNGRLISTGEGYRCMAPPCGKVYSKSEEGVTCQCGETMSYTGLNSYGEPVYACTSCGSKTKL